MSDFQANKSDGAGVPDEAHVRTSPTMPARTATHAVVPPPPRTVAAPRAKRSTVRRVIRAVLWLGLGVTAAFALLILTYRFVPPPASTLMLLQRASGTNVTRTWVPLDKISPNLVRAVIMSEDAGFCRHMGVDWRELFEAIENANDGIARGGSTISMQTAKNLFLWPSKSYVRKALEIPLTLGMELAWPKTRMLEIYLNIAEWGPGIFGAEAAARHHFRKPASRLTEREAALLAVSLPAPLVRDPGAPSPLLNRMSQTILARMRAITRHTACVLPERKATTASQ